MAGAWNPPLYQPTGRLRGLISSRRLLLGSLALAALPAAAGTYAIRSNYFQSPRTTLTSQESSSTLPEEVSSIQALGIGADTSAVNDSRSSIQVTVNGQDVPVAEDGTVNETISTNGGTTDVKVDSSSESGSDSSSSLNVNLNTSSSSTGNSSERSSTRLRIRSSSE